MQRIRRQPPTYTQVCHFNILSEVFYFFKKENITILVSFLVLFTYPTLLLLLTLLNLALTTPLSVFMLSYMYITINNNYLCFIFQILYKWQHNITFAQHCFWDSFIIVHGYHSFTFVILYFLTEIHNNLFILLQMKIQVIFKTDFFFFCNYKVLQRTLFLMAPHTRISKALYGTFLEIGIIGS